MDSSIESGQIKILSNPEEIQQLYHNLIRSAYSEISLLVATPNALLRQHKIGLTDLVKEAAVEKNVRVNLAIPRYETEKQTLQQVEELPAQSQNIRVRKYLSSINQNSRIKSTILLVDRQFSLIIDLKDDSQDTFTDAVGFATYSRSKSRTQSYSFIFDTVWRQSELYRQLELRTIELEKLNDLQNEFVNIAAHELRTPTQAILGYSEMLEQCQERNKTYEKAISRNAQRLFLLTSDMLDVAKIESQTLKLNKSRFDLNEEIENVIKDIVERPSWTEISRNVNFVFEPEISTIVNGDRERISQVIQNLVSNAVKFTDAGTITISVEKNNQSREIIVTVIDTGTGIDKDILPRLFMKFATKSKSGTGLGLFISKGIIEAHGGSLEAHNNVDSVGATFRFTIPLTS
ncbi:MAG TPA: HAMP domain-containing sensor histidine kinase [Nitrososphaeraceae archaeon]